MHAAHTVPDRASRWSFLTPGRLLGAARSVHPRTRRVLLLIVAIFMMSIGDLLLTLTYLKHLGMAESNPLARLVLDFRSPELLVIWKMATVLACTSILLWKSRSRSAEIGAWTGVLILGALMAHWVAYVKIAPPVPIVETASLFAGDDRWMTLAPVSPTNARASVPTP